MDKIVDFLYYPIIDEEGFVLSPLNIIIFVALFVAAKLIQHFAKRLFKSKDLVAKPLTVEGKEFPILRLVKQFIWLIIVFVGFRSLEINNPDLASSQILLYEFVRFKNFHIAVYHVFLVIVIIFFSRILINFVRIYLAQRLRKRSNVDDGSMYVYLQLTKYVIIVLAIIFVLRSMGVDLDLFLTSIAFLLVGLGLGLQDIFSDFFAGLLLLFEGSIRVGDIVEIDRPKEENFIARIVEINLRTSKVETRDGKVLVVPNSQLAFQSVNNWTSGKKATRFMIQVSVSYGSDLELVKEILEKCAQDHPKVMNNKDVVVRLLNFGDNGYELDVAFWANQNFYIDIHKSEIRFEIDKAFRKNGIVYPFPQMDVHVASENIKPAPDTSDEKSQD